MAKFSQTKLGQQACRELLPARDESACQALLRETGSVDALLTEYAADLDFGGIQTAEVGDTVLKQQSGLGFGCFCFDAGPRSWALERIFGG